MPEAPGGITHLPLLQTPLAQSAPTMQVVFGSPGGMQNPPVQLPLWQSLGKTVVFVTHSVFESVYLSQRVLVMTPRPGRILSELSIDAPYPRDERFRTSGSYVEYCRRVSQTLSRALGEGQ